jgi:hypothetical protein
VEAFESSADAMGAEAVLPPFSGFGPHSGFQGVAEHSVMVSTGVDVGRAAAAEADVDDVDIGVVLVEDEAAIPG